MPPGKLFADCSSAGFVGHRPSGIDHLSSLITQHLEIPDAPAGFVGRAGSSGLRVFLILNDFQKLVGYRSFPADVIEREIRVVAPIWVESG